MVKGRLRLGGLWRHPDFMKFWIGETVSVFGARVSNVAIPLAAALTLQATSAQMGILNAAQFAPFLIITLFAGVWVDRRRRRPIMIWANVMRGLLLGLIPLIAWLGTLRMGHLYAVVFLLGVFQVLFDLAYQAYLPALVDRNQLVEGNSKLQTSYSAAEVGGPGLAGILVELVTAPMAIIVNTVSYVVAAVTVLVIRKPEPEPEPDAVHRGLWREIADGFRIVYKNPYLLAVGGEAATYNLFGTALSTVYVLYATRDLAIQPGMYGLIFSIGAVGALLGAMSAGWLAKRFGFGMAILGSMCVACTSFLLVPLASGHSSMNIVILGASFFFGGMGCAVSNVHVVTLRQAITPDRLLGRMNASYRFVTYGAIPIGAMLGGALGEIIGLRATILASGIGILLSLLWVIFSPVPRLAQVPTEPWALERQAAVAESGGGAGGDDGDHQ